MAADRPLEAPMGGADGPRLPPLRASLTSLVLAAVLACGLPAVAGAQSATATSGPDTLTGTEGPDSIDGREGDDVIDGLGGDDKLSGSSGADTLRGGDGDDDLDGGSSGDVLEAGAGNDVLSGRSGDDRIDTVDGRVDVVQCGGDIDRVRADSDDLVDREACENIEVVGTFDHDGEVGTLPNGEGEGMLPAGAPNDPKYEAQRGVPPADAPGAGSGSGSGSMAGCRVRRTVTFGLPRTRGRVASVRAQIGGKAVRLKRLSRTKVRVTLRSRPTQRTVRVRLVIKVAGKRRGVVRRRTVSVCA